MLDTVGTAQIDGVVRTLATAGRALRLYPPSSPIPRQTIQAAEESLAAYFRNGDPVVSLTIARDGFALLGQPIGVSASGARELASELRDHAVAELNVLPDCSADDLLGFLSLVMTSPKAGGAWAGLSDMLAAAGIETIRVASVQLTVVEQATSVDDSDVDEFLRSLAHDPEKIGTWFAAASAGDPATFEEGLAELTRVCGPTGFQGLLESLAGAFVGQSPEAKDALLNLALSDGPVRDLTGGMFRLLSSDDIAGSLLGGSLGKNMLSLSCALTNLPLEQVAAQVRAEVQALLPSSGHTAKEAVFLEHMTGVRHRGEPEPALADADKTYRAAAEAARLSTGSITASRKAVTASHGALAAAGVRTMLQLLDQQKDPELYCSGADNLASMVPRLVEERDLALAARVVRELADREAFNLSPWPHASARLHAALELATGPRTMSALMRAVAADRSLAQTAREMVRNAGEAGCDALVTEAIALKGEGLEVAEELMGRRIVDVLNSHAEQTQWFRLAPIVTRLAREADPRSLTTIETLMHRSDEQSRREVAIGLAAGGGVAAQRFLGTLLRDPSAAVQIIAARAIARHSQPGAAQLLAARLSELDLDNGDFGVGRELIGSLARLPGSAADDALSKLASRRALIKRGHFSEVRELANQALAARSGMGAGR